MSCPSCANLLQRLSVTTNSGGRFGVDHCGRCGGTWFDPYEINRIPYHEIVRLAKVTVLPKKLPKSLGKNLCPRCHRKLKKYSGETVAIGVSLLRCGKCHGIWATQKTLEKFKKHQEEVVTEYKASKVAFPALSVVFIPALFVALFFVSTFVTLTSLQKREEEVYPLEPLEEEERMIAPEQISNLQTSPISSTTESVTFQTKTPLVSYISYGTSPLRFSTKKISEKPTRHHRILLTNLEPETSYVYWIILENRQGREFKMEKKVFRTK